MSCAVQLIFLHKTNLIENGTGKRSRQYEKHVQGVNSIHHKREAHSRDWNLISIKNKMLQDWKFQPNKDRKKLLFHQLTKKTNFTHKIKVH